MSIPSLFLLATLIASPAVTPAEGTVPAPSDYRATLTEIDGLSERMNFGEPVNAELEDALITLAHHAPQLAADPEAQQLRTRAQLQLARSALSDGDQETAVRIVDEAIRSAMGDDVPIDEFGPSLAKLYAERHAILLDGGKASLDIACAVPCRAFLDEHEIGLSIADLPLGVYRLWIEGAEGPGASQTLTEVVRLEIDGERVERVFDPNVMRVVEDDANSTSESKPRLLPRGVEAVLVAVGIGMAGAGTLMMAIRPHESDFIAGGVLFGVGAGALVAGSVALGIDEIRLGNQRGRRAMVAWTLRF
jgi:hypothetical protein